MAAHGRIAILSRAASLPSISFEIARRLKVTGDTTIRRKDGGSIGPFTAA